MPIVSLPTVQSGVTLEELAELVARLIKEVDYLQGTIDSKNVREIGGYKVSLTSLEAKNGVVGLSSERTGGDDLRIWAGDSVREVAAFRVYESGRLVASDVLITTTKGTYPYIELSSGSNFLAAYSNESISMILKPLIEDNPAILISNPTLLAIMGGANQRFAIVTAYGNGHIQLNSGEDLELYAEGSVKFQNWSKILNSTTGKTLQQELNSKANAFSGANASISVAYQVDFATQTVRYAFLTFNNGILTSVVT